MKTLHESNKEDLITIILDQNQVIDAYKAEIERLQGIIAFSKKKVSHWEIVNKKCNEDPMFQELWNQILVLMKLEQ
jgi:hypothetical protein